MFLRGVDAWCLWILTDATTIPTASTIWGNLQNCFTKHRKQKGLHAHVTDTHVKTHDCMRRVQRRGYLVVGVTLRIEGGERRGWDIVQPLSLWVRPRLVIEGNLRRFYLWCTDRAQRGAALAHTHAHTHTPGNTDMQGKLQSNYFTGSSLTATQLQNIQYTTNMSTALVCANNQLCISTPLFSPEQEVTDNRWPWI